MGSLPILRSASTDSDWAWQAVAIAERAAALLLFVVLLPPLALCALGIAILSRRTPFIAHRRVGWHGATLWMWKLRTMWESEPRRGTGWIEHIEDDSGPELKSESDSRVPSRLARFCRRHSIDELPQLWHVISGEMSLVGPRPITRSELDRHYGAHAGEVLRAKPGLAGLWQISGRNRLTYAERCQLDLRLVRERSISLYFHILVRTLPEVVRGKNSW